MRSFLAVVVLVAWSGLASAVSHPWTPSSSKPGPIGIRGPAGQAWSSGPGQWNAYETGTTGNGSARLVGQYIARSEVMATQFPVTVKAAMTSGQVAAAARSLGRFAGPVGLGLTVAELIWNASTHDWSKSDATAAPSGVDAHQACTNYGQIMADGAVITDQWGGACTQWKSGACGGGNPGAGWSGLGDVGGTQAAPCPSNPGYGGSARRAGFYRYGYTPTSHTASDAETDLGVQHGLEAAGADSAVGVLDKVAAYDQTGESMGQNSGTPVTASGPSTVAGPTTTTNTTNPVTTNVTNNTFNNTYSSNQVTINSTTTTTTTNPDGSTSTSTTGGTPAAGGDPGKPQEQLECGSLSCESTQLQLKTEVTAVKTELTAASAPTLPDQVAVVTAAKVSDKGAADAISTGITVATGGWTAWVWTPPTGTCSAPVASIAGHTVTFNYCPMVANIRDVLGWLLALCCSWHIWNVLMRRD